MQIESLEDIVNNATIYWRKLADICLKNRVPFRR